MGKKINWNADRTVSISAILISLMTLVVLVFQTNMIRQQQRLSVYPHLTIANAGYGTPDYKLILTNSGIGPALIESTKIYYQDSIYNMDLPSFVYGHLPGADSLENVSHSNVWQGLLIPPEEIIAIFEVDNSIKDANLLTSILSKTDMRLEIIYRSIYEERWRITSESGFPEKID